MKMFLRFLFLNTYYPRYVLIETYFSVDIYIVIEEYGWKAKIQVGLIVSRLSVFPLLLDYYIFSVP